MALQSCGIHPRPSALNRDHPTPSVDVLDRFIGRVLLGHVLAPLRGRGIAACTGCTVVRLDATLEQLVAPGGKPPPK